MDAYTNIYVADTGNHTIRMIVLDATGTNGVVSTLAGLGGFSGTNDGVGSTARFYYPIGLAMDSNSNLYVADYGNHAIRKMTLVGTDWVVTTLAGQGGVFGNVDGTGSAARFKYPEGLAVDGAGNVFVGDWATMRFAW